MQSFITGDNIALFIVLMLACAWAVSQFLGARSAINKYQLERQQPFTDLQEQVRKHSDMLASDKRRIEALEQKTATQQEELRLLLRSMMALLHHEMDGNNTAKLKECSEAIEQFLTNK